MIVGFDFIVVMTFFHGSAGDCRFITTFYKAATLIMGKKSCLIISKGLTNVECVNRVD